MNRITYFLLLSLPACATAGQIGNFTGGFANACAGYDYFSLSPAPGSQLDSVNSSSVNCSQQTGSNGSAASASATNSGTYNAYNGPASFVESASAQASLGYIHVQGSNSPQPGIPFPGAAANAGWNDTFTITGGTGSAFWIAPLKVQGTATATGAAALTRVAIQAFKDHNPLPGNNQQATFASNKFLTLNGGNVDGGIRNSVIGYSWSDEYAAYGAYDYGPGSPFSSFSVPTYTLDRTIYFVIPFTFGVQFEAGFYFAGVAQEGSSGPGNNTSTFSHTVTWGGAGTVIDANSAGLNFSVTSGSGFNYSQAYDSGTPEPGTAILLTTALGGLCWYRRRQANATAEHP